MKTAAKPTYRIITQPDDTFAVVTLSTNDLPTLRPGFATAEDAQAWVDELVAKAA